MEIFLFLFIFILKIILAYNKEVITNFTKLIELINEINVTSNESKKIIESTKALLEEYPFTNILKDPPKINGKNYFVSVDLLSNLDSLQSEIEKKSSMKYYEFYQKYYKIIKQTNDNHVHMEYEKNDTLKDVKIYSPIVIKTIDENKKLFLKLNPNIKNPEIVPNYDKINNKVNVSINKINDKNPFEFIRNFCKDYFTFKNKNAKFTYTKKKLYNYYLKECPMNSDEFNLTIKYDDNDIIETMFIGEVDTNNNQNNSNKSFEYFWNFKNEEKENIKKGNITNPNLLNKLQESKYINKTIFRNFDEGIKWDYDKGSFKCRVDKKKSVNVYFQNSFDFNFDFKEIIKECQNKFLSNDYPIIIIENFNGGGSIQFSILFSEIVQNLYNNQLKCSIKIGKYTEDISEKIYEEFLKENGDNYQSNKEFLKDYTTDELSDDNEYNRTKQKPFQLKNVQDYKDCIIRDKYKKPTEIIIFTDGYSFSATSFFIKSLYHFGGAIIVGFNGDPDTEKKDFDASQSPTFTFVFNNFPEIQIQELEDLGNFGYYFDQISYGPSYKNQYIEGKLDYPEEFSVTPVDERVNIYDEYDDTLYEKFIDKAKKIFEKYNKDGNCNKDNKNLKMLNTECDKNFDKYTKGGYECGKNGKWSDKCKPFYCHKNYYFDYVNQKCVKDVIAEKYSIYFSESKTTEEKKIEELEGEIKKLENELKKEKNHDDPYKTPFIILLIIDIIILVVSLYFCCCKNND